MHEDIRTWINNHDALARHLGIEITTISDGYAKATLPMAGHNCNGLGILHGAAIFALADVVFSAAAMSKGSTTVSIAASINFIAPGTTGPFAAEARLMGESRKLCTIEVDVTDGTETLIARFTGTSYKIGPRQPATAEPRRNAG